jgi:excisionase family DNA binding protein
MPKTRGPILTVYELSEYLRVNKNTIYKMVREGKLPGFRLGSDWRFHLDAIKRWQRDQMEQWQRDQMKDNTRNVENGIARQ